MSAEPTRRPAQGSASLASDNTEFRPSETIGPYRIVRVIGRGGMGIVYEADDARLERQVAIKVLSAGDGARHPASPQFLREARAVARLNHPNVVTIHDVGEHRGSGFIAMELLAGSAARLVENNRAAPWRLATQIVADACRGLMATHAAGLVHGDIKPANLLRAHNATVKLSDFGLARRDGGAASSVSDPVYGGTPHYMSPEQCRCEPLQAASDIYSLGATYYCLLSGRPPYVADTAVQVMFAHCSAERPPTFSESDPPIPAACAAVVRRAMAKQPSRRYASAAQMLADLEAILRDEKALELNGAGPPRRTRDRVHRPLLARLANMRRRSLVIGLAGGCLALLCTTLALAWWGVPDETPAEGTASSAVGAASHATEIAAPAVVANHAVAASPPGNEQAAATASEGVAPPAGKAKILMPSTPEARQIARNAKLKIIPPFYVSRGLTKIKAIAVSPDDKLVACGNLQGGVYLFQNPQHRRIQVLWNDIPIAKHGLAFSADGGLLYAVPAHTQKILVWNFAQEREEAWELAASESRVSAVAFSADRRWLAVARAEDSGSWGRSLEIWDVAARRMLASLPENASSVDSMAFVQLPDAEPRLVTSKEKQLRLWDANTGTLLSETMLTFRAADLGGSPTEALVGLGGWDAIERALHFLDPCSGHRVDKAVATCGYDGHVTRVVFSPDGQWVASAEGNLLVIRNAATRQPRAVFPTKLQVIDDLAWFHHSPVVLTAGEDHCWDWQLPD